MTSGSVLAAVQELADPQRVQAAVREVFADPVLAEGLRTRTVTPLDWREALLAVLLGWLNALQRWLWDLEQGAPLLYWVLMGGLLVVLGLLLWHIVASVLSVLRGDEGEAREAAASAAEQARLTYRELRARAREEAARGDLREAVRSLLLALLALLAERDILQAARGWTVREIVARLPAPIGAGLQPMRTAFERAAFGGRRLLPGEFEALERALDAIVEART